jgi:2-iminobutanoate/2-iminopropanoate deaminase
MQDRKVIKVDGLTSELSSPAVAAAGLIFASAVSGFDADPSGARDIEGQTRLAINTLRKVLQGAGSSLEQVASVNVYLKQASDFDAMNIEYRRAFAEKQPVRTTVVADLPAGARIALSAIAVPNDALRETLQPAGWAKSPRPYSYIVRTENLVFLSGLLSRNGVDDKIIPGPVSVQTKQILDNAGVLLKTAGLSYDDVVAARVFLVDDSLFDDMNNAYRGYFTNEPPARATAITPLMSLEATVEITLIASRKGKQVLGPAVAPSLPLSSAVRAGDLLFLSGVLGNTDTNTSDMSAQAREIFTRIRRTLDAAGVSFNHVVDNTVYVTDVWQQKKVDEVSREIFSVDPPARTVVGTSLVTRAGLVEMMMTASGR